MRLILVRHGETVWNAERRLQGHANAPLSPRGIEQAQRAAKFFADSTAPSLVVSSDLTRAGHTANLLGFTDFVTDKRLREMDLGDWTGQWIEQIEASNRGAYRQWRLGTYTPPNGEGWGQFRARVSEAINEAIDRSVGDVVIVTHEGVVRAACDVLVGLAPSTLLPVAPAAITIFDIDRSALSHATRLVAFNITLAPEDLRVRGLDHAPV